MSILAVDLAQSKSVACVYEAGSGAHRFETIATTPAEVVRVIEKEKPQRVAIEIGSRAGFSRFDEVNPRQEMTLYLWTKARLFDHDRGTIEAFVSSALTSWVEMEVRRRTCDKRRGGSGWIRPSAAATHRLARAGASAASALGRMGTRVHGCREGVPPDAAPLPAWKEQSPASWG